MATDRRQRKTKCAVQKAFMELMLERDISKITVKDIAERADINRSTFYLHYYDVYDILEEMERDAVDRVVTLASLMDLEGILRDPYPLLKTISEEMAADPLFTRFLMETTGKTNFYSRIESELGERLAAMFSALHPDADRDYLHTAATFVTSGVFGVYAKWFSSARRAPLETLCKIISELITAGIRPI